MDLGGDRVRWVGVYDKKYIIQKASVVKNDTEIEWRAVEVDV